MSSEKRFPCKVVIGERLIQARARLKFSQAALAEAVGTTARSISRWEHDQAIPQSYYRQRLCTVLESTPEALFGTNSEEQQTVPQPGPLWYVPYIRNPYFTGREAILRQIHERCHVEHQIALTQPHILSGLGGIGKTQTALEYAYRFRSDYQAVLWIEAETPETLMIEYLALAQIFHLPEKDSSNHALIRAAVKRWFQNHANWLLIFDQVEDLELLHTVLPDTSQGHILIITHSQIVGALGSHISLQKLEPAEGALFLLRRAKLLPIEAPLEAAPASIRAHAGTLVELLDGLPLALDQAAAYVEETACSLSEYLERYATRRKDLLSIRGMLSSHHPASVTATLSLAVQRVMQTSPITVDLLHLCAFLHAETIPEAFFTQAREAFGPELQALFPDPLAFDAAIKELRRFSLIHRESKTRTLSLHRLLQFVIQDGMKEDDSKLCVERLVRTLLHIFPVHDDVYYATEIQQDYQQYLPHVLVLSTFLKKWDIISLEAGELLYRAAVYLQFWGDHVQAVPLLLQAVHIAKNILGTENAIVASYLDSLGISYSSLKQHMKADKCFKQALAIRKRIR